MPTHFTLPSRITLVEITDLHDRMVDALSRAQGDVQIDASAVEDADISVLQLLVAADVSLKMAGRGLDILSSPALQALADRAGLSLTARRSVAPP